MFASKRGERASKAIHRDIEPPGVVGGCAELGVGVVQFVGRSGGDLDEWA
jgi:hypothetical protein